MRKLITISLAGLLLLMSGLPNLRAQTQEVSNVNLSKDVSLDQKLSAQIPLDTEFQDSTGKTVRLRDYFGEKPVVLVLPFYKCRGSCAMELDGMIKCFKDLEFELGKEFNALTVSIHPKETPSLAAAKKKEYEELYRRPGAKEGWQFLVGSWDSIQTLTKSVGFRFVYDPVKDQIAHPAGIIVITPQGRVSRYFYGINFKQKDVRLALVEASNNKIGTLADKVTLYCSTFDMVRGKYTPSIMRILRILGVATALMVGGMIFILSRTSPNQPRKPGSGGGTTGPGETPPDA